MSFFYSPKIRRFTATLALLSFIVQIFGVSPSLVYADDTTPPVLTLIGSDPMDTAYGQPFTDPGAEYIDDTDGTGSISASSGMVDENTLGTYILEYSYTDLAGNPSNTLTRTVNVIDLTAPTITLV